MKNVLKILFIGGLGYLAYKYLLPYFKKENYENDTELDETNFNDGRVTFYGKDNTSYVRGYTLPNDIKDFKIYYPILITKPDEEIFGEAPRTAIQVRLDVEKNKIQYTPVQHPKEIYVADYSEVKDKFVMLNNYLAK